MQSLSACLVVAALLVAAPVNAQFQINTPASITQCVPTEFTWTGGQEPYFLAINPGAGVPGATAFQQFSGITGTSFIWRANISLGTSIALELTDVNGEIAESAPVTIQSGASNSCLNSAQSSASGPPETSTAGSTDTGKSTTRSSTSITAGASSRTGDGTSAGSAPHTPGTSEVPSTGQPVASPLTTTTTDPTASSATFIGISNSLSIAPTPTVSAQSTGQAESRVSTGTVAAIATGIGAVAVLLATAASFLYIKRRRNRGPAAHAQPFTGASRSSADRGGGDRGGPGMDDEDVVTRATSSLMARGSSVGDSSSAQDRVGRLPRSHRENISGGITASEKHLREFTQLKGRNRTVLTTSGERNVNGQPRPETHPAAMFEDPVSIGHGVERRRHPRHETDGGVRLEGGRPGEAVVDDLDQSDSMSEGSGTLPPPYASHFGDM